MFTDLLNFKAVVGREKKQCCRVSLLILVKATVCRAATDDSVYMSRRPLLTLRVIRFIHVGWKWNDSSSERNFLRQCVAFTSVGWPVLGSFSVGFAHPGSLRLCRCEWWLCSCTADSELSSTRKTCRSTAAPPRPGPLCTPARSTPARSRLAPVERFLFHNRPVCRGSLSWFLYPLT